MNNIFKYILICLGTIILEWVFLAFVVTLFGGTSFESALVLGAAFFLAVEMVICTGVILSKIDKNK